MSRIWSMPLAVCAILALAGSISGDDARGRDLYTAACARCHGADGRGASQSDLGFPEAIPDFTDCRFGPREPDLDWVAVAHDGGPARAFGRMMPAFGEAISRADLESVITYVRTFCAERSWPRGDLNFPRPLVTEKAFPEDELVVTSSVAEGGGSIANKLIYEQRIGARTQYEVIVPFSWSESSPGEWSSGVGDVAIGAKRVFYHSLPRGSIFSGTAEVKLPTGSEDEGFGKGAAVLEPFLGWGQLLPAEVFLHVQTGAELPFDRDLDDEAFFRFALGRSFDQRNFGRSWSPMVEALVFRDLVSEAQTHWDVVPQMQVTLSQRQHIMANIGVRIPLDDRDSRDTEIVMYLLWDWFDGGLSDGW